MLVPAMANVKLASGNMGHAPGIGIILCHFTNCPIIYQTEPVYYCPDNPYNTISFGDLKCCVGFQKVTSEPIEHFYFVDPQGLYWKSLY